MGIVGAKILGPRAMVGVSETSVKELQSKASVAAVEGTAEQGQTPRNKLRALAEQVFLCGHNRRPSIFL